MWAQLPQLEAWWAEKWEWCLPSWSPKPNCSPARAMSLQCTQWEWDRTPTQSTDAARKLSLLVTTVLVRNRSLTSTGIVPPWAPARWSMQKMWPRVGFCDRICLILWTQWKIQSHLSIPYRMSSKKRTYRCQCLHKCLMNRKWEHWYRWVVDPETRTDRK